MLDYQIIISFSYNKPSYSKDVQKACRNMKKPFGQEGYKGSRSLYKKALKIGKREHKQKIEADFSANIPKLA